MSEEGGEPAQQSETIAELKEMFAQQFAEIRQQNEETVKQLNETIEQLRKDNASLKAEVVRSATMALPKKEPEKTPEEIYADRIMELRGVALDVYKKRGNY